MTRIHNPFDSDDFLQTYWQQTPLLKRQAFDLPELISRDDLAGLALESEVESRLIRYEPDQNQWHLLHGPFAEEDFTALPDENWTLLVQAVDHWVPAVRDFLKTFSFLPQWRADDIMISFAPPGGGVGPHFDQYDVFLVQLEGKREWKVGQVCDENTDLVEHMPVKILTEFEEQERWVLEPGDVLYLPPAVAHWGTSVDHSLTLSVGFRAPAINEIVSDLGHFLSAIRSDFERYQDAGISNRRSHPHKITESDINRIRNAILTVADDRNALSQWFGQYMTESKYDDGAVETGDWTFQSFLSHWQESPLVRNSSSRLAYCNKQLFIDGQSIETHLSEKSLHTLCDTEVFEFEQAKDLASPECHQVLWSLVNLGALYFED